MWECLFFLSQAAGFSAAEAASKGCCCTNTSVYSTVNYFPSDYRGHAGHRHVREGRSFSCPQFKAEVFSLFIFTPTSLRSSLQIFPVSKLSPT